MLSTRRGVSRPAGPCQLKDAGTSSLRLSAIPVCAGGAMRAAVFRPAAAAEPVRGYRLEVLLGKGGFGEVWRATGPGGFPVAMKFLSLDGPTAARELQGLRLLVHARDAHLLSIHGVWRLVGLVVLAMDLADGTLMDRLNQCRRQGR